MSQPEVDEDNGPLESGEQPVLCCPVAEEECQDGQTGSPGARLTAQQGRRKGPASVESNISCKNLGGSQHASLGVPTCLHLSMMSQQKMRLLFNMSSCCMSQ